jgi:hypothetical protein
MHKTISIQGRIDICSFATLARAYKKEGNLTRTKSDVLWRAVEQLAALYSRKHDVEAFTSIPAAIAFLDIIDMPLGTNTRAQRSLLQAEADEAFFLETGEDIGRRTTKTDLIDEKGELNLRNMHRDMCNALHRDGKEAMSFEAYCDKMENQKKPKHIREESVDVDEFASKEAEKKRKLKEAMNSVPTATATA